MPYPYGTQNAPVVGNGLGGLPRRAVATAAVAATTNPITFSKLTSGSTSIYRSMSGGGYFGGFVVFNNKILMIQKFNNGSGDLYYSSVTFLNEDGTINGSTTNYAMHSSAYSAFTYSSGNWQPSVFHIIDDTTFLSISGQTVYRLTLNSDGSIASGSQFTVPSTGTYVNGGSWSSLSTVGPTTNRGALVSGNFVYLARRDNNGYVGIFKFTLDGTFVAGLQSNSYGNLGYYSVLQFTIFKATFGFVCAWITQSSYIYCEGFSFNESFTQTLSEAYPGYFYITNGSTYTDPYFSTMVYDYSRSCIGVIAYEGSPYTGGTVGAMQFNSDGTKKYANSDEVKTYNYFGMMYGNGIAPMGMTGSQVSSFLPVISDATSLRMLPVMQGRQASLQTIVLQASPTVLSGNTSNTTGRQYGFISSNVEGLIPVGGSSNAQILATSPDLSIVVYTENTTPTSTVYFGWVKLQVTR